MPPYSTSLLIYLLSTLLLHTEVSRALLVQRPDHEMETINFGYSTKNIPIPPNDKYLFVLTQMTEEFIKRLRWKGHFFLKENIHTISDQIDNKFKLKTHLCPNPVSQSMSCQFQLTL